VNSSDRADFNLGQIICNKLLTKGFLPQFEHKIAPAQFVSFFFADHKSTVGKEEIEWNKERRSRLLEFLSTKVNELELQYEQPREAE
jgi:hypothetical protein